MSNIKYAVYYGDTQEGGVYNVLASFMRGILKGFKDANLEAYTFEECITYLKDLEKESGGSGDWRYISFDLDGECWVKYIRMLKYNDKWFLYTEFGNIQPISMLEYLPEKINKNYLNFE